MQHRYLIDGYNLLLRWRRGKLRHGPGNLQRARDALLAWIAARLARDDQAIVVFDAHGESRDTKPYNPSPNLRIVFATDHASADDWIIQECSRSTPETVVVSNDWEIQVAAKRANVRVISSDDFITASSTDFTEHASTTKQCDATSPGQDSEKPTSLTDLDLARFREEMQLDLSPKPTANSDNPSPKTRGKSHQRKPNRTEPDLDDFYRQMRDTNFDQET